MDTPVDSTLLTRRAWLQGSALLALVACAATGARALAPSLSGLPADALVIDAGLPDATTLARGAGSHARVEMLGDDLGELFYGRLAPAWRERGVRGLMGLTRAPALFLLEPLAAEYGLRTVGLERAPRAGCAALDNLCHGPQRRRSAVGREPIREAMLVGDEAAFAWWMAPVRRPMHAGVTVIPS
jgi:hypothetical protein